MGEKLKCRFLSVQNGVHWEKGATAPSYSKKVDEVEKFVENPDFLQDIFLEESWKNIDKIDGFIESKANLRGLWQKPCPAASASVLQWATEIILWRLPRPAGKKLKRPFPKVSGTLILQDIVWWKL